MQRMYQNEDGSAIFFDGVQKHVGLSAAEAHAMARENDYITAARQSARNMWDGVNELKTMQREWTALTYGNTLDAGTGDHAGVTTDQVTAVVFVTANALDALRAAGHGTTMARLL